MSKIQLVSITAIMAIPSVFKPDKIRRIYTVSLVASSRVSQDIVSLHASVIAAIRSASYLGGGPFV